MCFYCSDQARIGFHLRFPPRFCRIPLGWRGTIPLPRYDALCHVYVRRVLENDSLCISVYPLGLVVLYLEHGAIPDAIPKPVEHGPDPGPVVAVVEDQAKLLAIQGGVDHRPVGVIDHGALLRSRAK